MSTSTTLSSPSPLPALSCNAHCHVFGPGSRFPYAGKAAASPPADRPREELYALNDRLGLERCVVVQSAVHGTDNRATEHAIAGRPDTYRGVALLGIDVPDAELRRLDAAGFRGVRFNFMAHLGEGTPIDDVLALAARIEPLGWHLQIHGSPDLLTRLGPALRRSPVPVVIDHIGRVDASLGLQQPDFEALLGLMDDDRFWVKVSGIDRISQSGPPYDDALPFARRLVGDYPERTVWGNDWPHPNHSEKHVDDDLLATSLHRIVTEPSALQRLMVDNPARLYRFGEVR